MVSPAAIDVQQLTMHFDDRAVIDDLTLQVEPGEFVTLLGPSGSGKTTLLRLIAGLIEPETGTISVHGTRPHTARASKQLALVPQSPALLPWRTVAENARLLLDVNTGANPTDGPDIAELLRLVGLDDATDALPHELSGGMQQRVGLVRAFALGAPVMLLDEPFAALDEITRADMRHLLVRLTEATQGTVLFVTHSIPEAVFLSDRVGVLSNRPAQLIGTVDIGFEHPRRPELEDDPAFFRQVTELRDLLRSGMAE